jgi:hypothetical protein
MNTNTHSISGYKILGILLLLSLMLPAFVAYKVCAVGVVFAVLSPVALLIMIPISLLTGFSFFILFQDCHEILALRVKKRKKILVALYLFSFILGMFAVVYMSNRRLEFWSPDYEILIAGGLLSLSSIVIPFTKYLLLRKQKAVSSSE